MDRNTVSRSHHRGVYAATALASAKDDTQSSAPVLTFHLLSGAASVSSQNARTYSRAYSEGGQAARGVVRPGGRGSILARS